MVHWLRRPNLWFLAGAVLIVFGAKLSLIQAFGSDVPYADQWTGEGLTIFQPLMRWGGVPTEHFFFPHGEHRPVTMRYWAYMLFQANENQWDGRVECVANLLFQVGTLLILWWVAGRYLSGIRLMAMRIVTVLICAAPCNFENFVWGFQSQFLLLVLGGLAHVAGTLTSTHLSVRWWLAQGAGIIAIISLSSGMMSAVALALLALFAIVRGRRDAWAWTTLGMNIALAVFGFWFLNPIVDAHDHSDSVMQFAGDMIDLWAWPTPAEKLALLGQVPLLVMAFRALRGAKSQGLPWVVLGLGLWVQGMMAALAFGRGGGGDDMFIATRYQDVIIMGCWTNLLAVFGLWEVARHKRQHIAAVVLSACVLPMIVGLVRLNSPSRIQEYARNQRAYIDKHDNTVREFLRTDDPAVFERDSAIRSAFPHLGFTIDVLRDPALIPILAPSLHAEQRTGPLSRAALIIVDNAWPILFFGVFLMLLALGLALRPDPKGLTAQQNQGTAG